MKTLKIQSENAKGLFTDNNSQNSLSEEVKKAFESGEKKVKIAYGEKTLTLTGYTERGKDGNNEAFKYVAESGKKYICKDLRVFFGLPTYSKKHTNKEKKFEVSNLELATKKELEELKEKVDTLLDEFYTKELKEIRRAEVIAGLTQEQRDALGL